MHYRNLIFKHIKLFNLVIAVLLLILLYIMGFVLKRPIEEEAMSFAEQYRYWIKYQTYDKESFIIASVTDIMLILLPVFLIIVNLFKNNLINKRIIVIINLLISSINILILLIYLTISIYFFLVLILIIILIIIQLIFNVQYRNISRKSE